MGVPHLFGTDHLGRDVLSRVIYGARVSLVIGFSAVLVGGVLGAALGILAGFSGGRVDAIIMTVADAQLAFPVHPPRHRHHRRARPELSHA